MTDQQTFTLEAERFIANIDSLCADDFAGATTAEELAKTLQATDDMSELLDALACITSKNMWSIPADDRLDSHALLIALARNPYLTGCIIGKLLDLRAEFPNIVALLAMNKNLSEAQAMRIAVVGDERVRMVLAQNRALPESVYTVLVANGNDAMLCVLMGNPTLPKSALNLIAPKTQERYFRAVALSIQKIQHANDPEQIATFYSPAMDERMDVAAATSPYLPRSAADVLQAKGSPIVRFLLEENMNRNFYRYSCM